MLAQLFESYTGAGSRVEVRAVRRFREAMARVDSRYAADAQQDAGEFMGKLFDVLGQTSNGKQHGNWLHSIFGVHLETPRQCQRCMQFAQTERSVGCFLGLPTISEHARFDSAVRREELATPISLPELLRRSQDAEQISGYDCACCAELAARNGTVAAKSVVSQRAGLIHSTHDVVIAVLYRFVNVVDTDGANRLVKMDRPVDIPSTLTLGTTAYSVYGVVSHYGQEISHGHYVASVCSSRDRQWYECNDAYVKPLHNTPGKAASFSSLHLGATPVILFYRRVPQVLGGIFQRSGGQCRHPPTPSPASGRLLDWPTTRDHRAVPLARAPPSSSGNSGVSGAFSESQSSVQEAGHLCAQGADGCATMALGVPLGVPAVPAAPLATRPGPSARC